MTALAGFLYQLVGSAAAVELQSDPTCDENQAEILLLEFGGEDAVAGGKLIQFKYSHDATEHPIRPGELADIFQSLEKAKNKNAGHGSVTVKSMELRTNRDLSDDAKAAYAGETPANIQAVEAEHVKTIIKFRQSVKIALETIDDHIKNLRGVSEQYGVLPDEWPSGLAAVVGNLCQVAAKHGTDRRITQSQLLEWIVGHTKPISLVAKDCQTDVQRRIDKMLSQHGHPTFSAIIPREALSRLSDYADKPVVVIVGNGGCGKSLSVFRQCVQWASTPPERLMYAICRDSIERDLASIVDSLRNRHGGSSNFNGQRALDRLVGANLGTRPILLLALDGIDEIPPEGVSSAIQLVHCHASKCG